jgi:hypothetical protein
LGRTPVRSEIVLRTLLAYPTAKEGGLAPGRHLALEGNVLSPTSVSDRARIRNTPGAFIPLLELEAEILRSIVEGLRKYGALTEGCLIHEKNLLSMYEKGLMDSLVVDCLVGNYAAGIQRCDPNSMEWVPDLCYETGLGIDTSMLETYYSGRSHSSLMREGNLQSVPDGDQRVHVSTVLGHLQKMASDLTNMFGGVVAGKFIPVIVDPNVLAARTIDTGQWVFTTGLSLSDPGPRNFEELRDVRLACFWPTKNAHLESAYLRRGQKVIVARRGSIYFGPRGFQDNLDMQQAEYVSLSYGD